MGTGIGHTEKVMCPILNHGQLFAITYDRAYRTKDEAEGARQSFVKVRQEKYPHESFESE